jgi:Flp pilus assembly pilin Flp
MKRLISDARGALMLEYVVILLLVAGGASAAIVMIGIAMAQYFAAQQAWLLIPFP